RESPSQSDGITVRPSSQRAFCNTIPQKADIGLTLWHVRSVPQADIMQRSKLYSYSITLSARARTVGGTSSPSAVAASHQLLAATMQQLSRLLLGRLHQHKSHGRR